MKYTFWGLALIMAGIFGVAFIAMFESITINNESEYYVLKEAMEAAMLESVDVTCYRNKESTGCGEVVKISEQKFVENFTRRFVASVSGDVSQYEIEFYDIIESPPKASVVIRGKTQNYNIMVQDEGDDGSFNIANSLDGILVYKKVSSADEVSPDTPSDFNNNFTDNSSSIDFEEVTDGSGVDIGGIPASVGTDGSNEYRETDDSESIDVPALDVPLENE